MLALIACMSVSCVEDEKNPFDRTETIGGETFDVKLPMYGNFIIGSEITLKGSGFTDKDRITVSNRYYSQDIQAEPIEARITSTTNEELKFIIPSGISAPGDIDVTITRNNASFKIGKISVGSINWNNNTQYLDRYTATSFSFYVYDISSPDTDKVYVQSIALDGETPAGPRIELPITYTILNDVATDMSYLTEIVRVMYEHNGEIALEEICHTGSYFNYYFSVLQGETVNIDWPGFIAGDQIELKSYDQSTTIASTIKETGEHATFQAPESSYPESYRIFLLRGGVECAEFGQIDVLN